jgi:plasmid stabilization system protein ParE
VGRFEKEVVEKMKRRFSLLHGVTDEIARAFRRYGAIREELGVRFLFELNEAFRRIREMPQAYAPGYRQVRRAGLRRFPHIVSYICSSDSVYIVAVRHGARSEKALRKAIRDRLRKGE